MMMMTSKVSTWRWVKTMAVLMSVANAGMNLGLLSPTFPDMATLMSCSMGQMATTMTWVGLASIIGSLGMGPLFDRFHSLAVLSGALLLEGLAIGLAPWIPVLIVYQFITAIASIFFIGILTGCLTANCIIWKSKPEMINPIVQVTDLFHALGIAITPQLIEPFLVGKHSPAPTAANMTSFPLEPATGNSSIDFHRGPETVRMAYVLVAVLDVIVAAICFAIFLIDRNLGQTKSYNYESNRMYRSRSYSLNADDVTIVAEEFKVTDTVRRRTSTLGSTVLDKNTLDRTRHDDMARMLAKRRELQFRKEEQLRNQAGTPEQNPETHGHKSVFSSSLPVVKCDRKILPLFAIVIVFLTISGGRDAMFTGLLFTYLNGYMAWPTYAGTMMVTVYHITRVVIHVLFVLLSKCVSPEILTAINHIIFLFSSLLMLFTIQMSPVFTAVGIVLTGFGTSNLHPSAITLAQESFQVDGKIMGVLIGSIFFGTSLTSAVAGPLLDAYGAVVFPVILLTVTVSALVFFVSWLIAVRSFRSGSIRSIAELDQETVVVDNEETPLIQSPA